MRSPRPLKRRYRSRVDRSPIRVTADLGPPPRSLSSVPGADSNRLRDVARFIRFYRRVLKILDDLKTDSLSSRRLSYPAVVSFERDLITREVCHDDDQSLLAFQPCRSDENRVADGGKRLGWIDRWREGNGLRRVGLNEVGRPSNDLPDSGGRAWWTDGPRRPV